MSWSIKPPGSRSTPTTRLGKKSAEPVTHRRVSEAEEKSHAGDEDALSREHAPRQRTFGSQEARPQPGGPLAGGLERPHSSSVGAHKRVGLGGVGSGGQDVALRQLANRVLTAFHQADASRQDAARSLFAALDR